MAFLIRLLDRLRAKPVPAPQPMVEQAPAQRSTAVDFDDFLRALGADL